MRYKREQLLLPSSQQAAVDTELFENFTNAHVSSLETYREMSVSGERKERSLEKLVAGQDVDLTVRDISAAELSGRVAALKEWKAELIANESAYDQEVIAMYRWRTNEDIANIHMLDASRRSNMKEFMRWNTFIYGEPDEAIYRAAIDWVAHDADLLLSDSSRHSLVDKAATEVLEMLDAERGYRELLMPQVDTFDEVRRDHIREGGFYSLLLSGVSIPEQKISKDFGDPILEHVIRENLESDYGIADSASGMWSVAHSSSTVERPPAYNLAHQRFVGLALGHETGSHLLEKINGERGPFSLLASGFDRYALSNEGRATIREQVVYKSFDEFGTLVRWRDMLRRHIAVSYAAGVGAQAPRSSRDLYAFMSTIDRMYQTVRKPDEPGIVSERAHRKTGALVTRVLRGVDGKQGGAYLKDKVYLEGHVACWLEAVTAGPGAISSGDLGKFDITNPRHVALLQKYQLLPEGEA